MKINEQTQPILKVLRLKRFNDFDPPTSLNNEILVNKKFYNNKFFNSLIKNSSIDYLSDSFINSFEKSKESFNRISYKECFSIGDKGICLNKNKNTFIYEIIEVGDDYLKLNLAIFFNDICMMMGKYNLDKENGLIEFTDESMNSFYFDDRNDANINTYRVLRCLLLIIFKKYAKIETKLLAKNTVSKISLIKKIQNKSKLNITYLDCSWFTTLIRSDEFSVRGHFRLQPYKNDLGEWTKKLIFINGFKKDGYTRRAKKLNTTENGNT